MSGILHDSKTGRRVTVSAARWDDDEVTQWDLSDLDSGWSERVTTEEFRKRCGEDAKELIEA